MTLDFLDILAGAGNMFVKETEFFIPAVLSCLDWVWLLLRLAVIALGVCMHGVLRRVWRSTRGDANGGEEGRVLEGRERGECLQHCRILMG